MTVYSNTLSARARNAVQSGNWPIVESCAKQILQDNPGSAEGHFLTGLVARAGGHVPRARQAFDNALSLDPGRYDAAVELAGLLLGQQHHAQAYKLLEDYRERLANSPRYLDMAATIYTHLGLPDIAWPLSARANALQPGVSLFQANLAACSVQVGRIDEARKLYRSLLERYPTHQRNHQQLSILDQARDDTHVKQMQEILRIGKLPPGKNIFLYYAIGKELEDLGRWDESFSYYKMAGDAANDVSRYDVAADERLMSQIVSVCTAEWLAAAKTTPTSTGEKTPIFIVGLPRTGTTLVERIVSSHSSVESVGETHFISLAIRRQSGIDSRTGMNPAIVEAAAKTEIGHIANDYFREVRYRFGDKPLFIDKLPENVLYAGFIAREFPDARIVHVQRSPMDACFAMYKQSYFRFAYSLDALARYYIAYDRLMRHWREVLGERLTEIEYENLVSNQEQETRQLLNRLGLDFEQACLDFETNPAASTTASSVQIRQKIHTGSIAKWRRFEAQLQPLRERLEAAGIAID